MTDAIQRTLNLPVQVSQRLDSRTRIVFVPSDGQFPADDERRMEAMAELFLSWISLNEMPVESYAIVQ